MNEAQKQAHAARMLDHSTAVHAQQRMRVAYLTSRQQWVAHYIGEPNVTGYGRTSAEAVAMLKQRSEG
jgi:hypothetical protein